MKRPLQLTALATLLFSACSALAAEYGGHSKAHAEIDVTKIVRGNGEHNWITTEGVTRSGNVLTFKEVTIAQNGWLVIHPFEHGKPNGDKYVASTFVRQGTTQNVEIEVFKGVETGENLVVMLHNDSNDNEIFDFVFVDDLNVMDKAVFEGNTIVAHRIEAP